MLDDPPPPELPDGAATEKLMLPADCPATCHVSVQFPTCEAANVPVNVSCPFDPIVPIVDEPREVPFCEADAVTEELGGPVTTICQESPTLNEEFEPPDVLTRRTATG